MQGRSPARPAAALAAAFVVASAWAVVVDAPPAAAAMQSAQRLDRRDLVGRWTDNHDCGEVTVLRRDGVFIAPNGAMGHWSVAGRRLKLSGPGGVVSWRVVLEDRDTMTLISDDGTRSQSTRCGARERPRPI